MPKQKEAEALYNSLTSIRFKTRGKVYEIDMGGELLVENEDLHTQVERLPAVMGYVGSIVALLETEYENKKDLKRRLEARIDEKVRSQGVIGEARIDKMIKRHPKWIEACLKVNKAREMSSRSKLLLSALKEKSIVMISRSADIRSSPEDAIMGVERSDVIRMDS